MLMEMAGSRSCRGSAFHEDGPDEQNARGPGVCFVSFTNAEGIYHLRSKLSVNCISSIAHSEIQPAMCCCAVC